jgi:hypothetical protein
VPETAEPVVWNRESYHQAVRAVDERAAAGDWPAAYDACVMICLWLSYMRRHAIRRRRRERLAGELDCWLARATEFGPVPF